MLRNFYRGSVSENHEPHLRPFQSLGSNLARRRGGHYESFWDSGGVREKPREELYSLDLAYRDPRVPWCAKLFIACVVGYGFSPIDLIPDFVPIIGDLDDPIWVPIEITLALKMSPPSVLAECHGKDRADMCQRKPTHWVAVPVIICIWVLFALLAIFLVTKAIKK